ncbi:MAG: hypothetical protein EOP56_01490 [Sphingobacteriales bacterium]|nr:MAG: hypothetical protein EOP56_01490 [Sphingobacteriales bacterium]
MKKFILTIAVFAAINNVKAQVGQGSLGDLAAFKPAAQISANIMAGPWSPGLSTTNLATLYPNTVNTKVGDLQHYNTSAFGINAQFGYFFGYARHFGLGGGLMYMRHQGNFYIQDFHVEYESTDSRGEVFRQIVGSGAITEKITASNFSIPIVGKYQTYFTDQIGFNLDAGLLLNVQMQNSYETNATFDYEAIYKYDIIGDNNVKAVYDNSNTPSSTSWLITKNSYTKRNPKGNVNAYFEEQRQKGYNVGSGIKPDMPSGKKPYKSGAIGFLVQPSVNYEIRKDLMLNVGGYYMMQLFSNEQTDQKLTDAVGTYAGLLSSVKSSRSSSYGISAGVKYYLRFKKEELNR